jgi:primosomal protein N' (replication factor Y)
MQDNEKKYANIVFPIPVEGPFSYLLPEQLRSKAQIGMRVLAPFGDAGNETEGVIVGFAEESEIQKLKEKEVKFKEIIDILDDDPFFSEDMLKLTKWIAEYYFSTWGEVLKSATPVGINIISKRIVKINEMPDRDKVLADLSKTAPLQAQILTTLAWEGEMSIQKLKTRVASYVYSALSALEKKGLISISSQVSKPIVKPVTDYIVHLAKPVSEINSEIEKIKTKLSKQAEVLEILISKGEEKLLITNIAKLAETTTATIKSLAKKGLVSLEAVEIFRDPLEGEMFPDSKNLDLNPDQATALNEITKSIEKGINDIFLLYGVTASGKTEVYMQAIGRLLEMGKSAIVLVPEIALTPQTVFRFASRFGKRVTVLHSKMTPGERYDQWRRIRSGDADIVVGARSAIFAPLKNLGLIVIDEEHETSYKQEESPRYHTRDVAIKRAEICNAVVVLGTATPSLESFYKANRKEYRLLTLPERVDNAKMPLVEVVDMRIELMQKKNRSIFSKSLQEAIEDRLAREEQIILFLNRRGFSTFILCRECGYVAKCKNCDISLTYHSSGDAMICHHCNFREPIPALCPSCKGNYIRHFGIGTQRVEEETRKLFPEAGIERMDVDTTTRKGAYKRILEAFKEREVDILIGTQMIAKGLDFPNVTLVGVISADTSLNLPDFRAGERTFNLLTQVAGRSGRGQVSGEVVIQTYNPQHFSILSAQDQDYRSFYRQEIINREMLLYPPFTHFARIILRGLSEEATIKASDVLGSILQSYQEANFPELEIMGPAPAPLARIKNFYRWNILLKSAEPEQIKGLIKMAFAKLPSQITKGDVAVAIDMDPMSVL